VSFSPGGGVRRSSATRPPSRGSIGCVRPAREAGANPAESRRACPAWSEQEADGLVTVEVNKPSKRLRVWPDARHIPRDRTRTTRCRAGLEHASRSPGSSDRQCPTRGKLRTPGPHVRGWSQRQASSASVAMNDGHDCSGSLSSYRSRPTMHGRWQGKCPERREGDELGRPGRASVHESPRHGGQTDERLRHVQVRSTGFAHHAGGHSLPGFGPVMARDQPQSTSDHEANWMEPYKR
jgi:hypothetical protein